MTRWGALRLWITVTMSSGGGVVLMMDGFMRVA